MAAAVGCLGCWVGISDSASYGTACSLTSAMEVRALLGYTVRIQKGETDADCVLLAIPVKLDPKTLSPMHPTIDFTVYKDGTRPRPFSRELADARKRGFGPVPGFGDNSYLVPGPQPGALGIYAKAGPMVINLDVGPSKTTVPRAKTVVLAHRIARRM